MAEYGYPRVSTPHQNIERQIRNIRAVCPTAIMYPEYFTGTTSSGRTQWQKLMARVKKGDTIYFDSISRMSRNAEEGMADYERLYTAGVNLVFLNEPHLDTAVLDRTVQTLIPMTGTNVDLILEGINNYLLVYTKEQVRIGFEQSEKEVMDLRKRTKEGLLTAKINGKVLGRPGNKKYETKRAKSAKADIRKMSKYFDGNMSDTDVIRVLGLQRNTYYKYKKEMQESDRDAEACEE